MRSFFKSPLNRTNKLAWYSLLNVLAFRCNRCGIYLVHAKRLSPCFFWLIEPPWPSLLTIYQKKPNITNVSGVLEWMSRPLFWNDEDLYPKSKPLSHLKCLRLSQSNALSISDHIVDFFNCFRCSDLIWAPKSFGVSRTCVPQHKQANYCLFSTRNSLCPLSLLTVSNKLNGATCSKFDGRSVDFQDERQEIQ